MTTLTPEEAHHRAAFRDALVPSVTYHTGYDPGEARLDPACPEVKAAVDERLARGGYDGSPRPVWGESRARAHRDACDRCLMHFRAGVF